ncbi:MAG: hypothetical protein GXP49_18665 [Deltaproteobacteria bacterium]|nr:hypothetical protein [Deltaproteobacteria bacterium]
MCARTRFNQKELGRLPGLLSLSEEVSAEYFKLTSFTQERFAYDVVTALDKGSYCRKKGVLAVLERYSREAPGEAPRTFFRISLQDRNILAALDRDDTLNFDDLMVFVFTHELVHIVRFVLFYKSFYAQGAERSDEEEKVQEITMEILKKLKRRSMNTVLEKWGKAGQTDILE